VRLGGKEATRKTKRMRSTQAGLAADNTVTSAEGYRHLLIDSAPPLIFPHTTINRQITKSSAQLSLDIG